MMKNPKAAKNRILSLLMLNPGYEFTTEDMSKMALNSEGYNVLYHSDIMMNIRGNIRSLRNEGYPIDSTDDAGDGRRRYFYNPKNIKHHLVFEPGMENKVYRLKKRKFLST